MDLLAYSQIPNLSKLAADNGIDVPRLRGYRLMKDEAPVTEEEIQELIEHQAIEEAVDLIRGEWRICNSRMYCDRITRNLYRYLRYTEEEYETEDGTKVYYKPVEILWDKIHGKRRKLLKWQIKKAEKRIRTQFSMWNRYAGQENVLYIHARLGGWNWKSYEGDLNIARKPWFLGKADDYWDGTYCDIYARIS